MKRGIDPSIRFERAHRMYGAVTLQQQLERAGQYYTLFWKANDRSQPVTVRFEYRQQSTGMQVLKLEQQVSEVRASNVCEFQVTGSAFQTGGRVTAWRASIVRGSEVLAIADSFLWK
jgi:hypothetical protein